MAHIVYYFIITIISLDTIFCMNTIFSLATNYIWSLKTLYWSFSIPVFLFNSLPNVAAFSNSSFSVKTSLHVKNSYLLTFPNNKAKIVAVCLSKLY